MPPLRILDSNYLVETPEGVDISLRPAGVIIRGLAFAIDFLIRCGLILALALGLSWFRGLGWMILSISWFVIEWFYPVFFEVLNQGMTPGKKWMGIRTVNDDGTPVDWGSSVIRNLMRVADFLPALFCAGISSMVIDKRFRRLGDIAAGTVVVYKEELHTESPIPLEGDVAQLPFPLALEERKAIVNFAERQGTLSRARSAELAGILGELTEPIEADSLDSLGMLARGFVGRTANGNAFDIQASSDQAFADQALGNQAFGKRKGQ